MQQQLFELEEIPVKKPEGLVISKAGKKALTKNQQAFNRLTQKIERLHYQLEEKQTQFDTALAIYGKEIHPVKTRLTEHRRELVTILWKLYKSKKLAKADQRCFKMILKDQVMQLCIQLEGGPDEALKKMFAELEGISFERMQEREQEKVKSEMEDLFEDMDLDIDFNGVDMNDEKAMFEKISEIQQKLLDRDEAGEEQLEGPGRKKKMSAKQQEKERLRKEVEEMKQKNIGTIYKQLAKLFHPDLEQDEERRGEKEILMKELVAAYEAKNLHTLLTLELKWIHKENDHLESLTDEKLAVYLQILREQSNELEQELNGMFRQPRYQVLTREFGLNVQRIPVETVKDNLRSLKKKEASFKTDLENFKSPESMRYVKAMITQWKSNHRRQKLTEEEEFLKMLFGQ